MNEANLLKLAAGLETLPDDYEHFNMALFFHNEDGEFFSPVTARDPHDCGSVACAIGHAPLFVTPGLGDESWEGYCWRVFKISAYTFAWMWCFGADWCHYDNTPKGAAQRIRYLVEHGEPPEDFHEHPVWTGE